MQRTRSAFKQWWRTRQFLETCRVDSADGKGQEVADANRVLAQDHEKTWMGIPFERFGLQPQGQGRYVTSVRQPPVGRLNLMLLAGAAGEQLQRRNTNASGGVVTQTTCTVFAGEDLVGMHAERLGVEVVDGVAVYLSASQYSVPKLQEHFGGNFCWPVVVSNKRASYPLTMCPCKGQPGHEPGGHMHLFDKHKKSFFLRSANAFRLRQGDTGFRYPAQPLSSSVPPPEADGLAFEPAASVIPCPALSTWAGTDDPPWPPMPTPASGWDSAVVDGRGWGPATISPISVMGSAQPRSPSGPPPSSPSGSPSERFPSPPPEVFPES